MKHLLNAILNRLGEVPLLKYVDENWDQLNDYPNTAVKFPCALVDLRINNKTDYLNLVQTGNYTIEIVVAHIKNTNSSLSAPPVQRQKSFEIYDIVDQVHDKLHGWSPTVDSGRMFDKTFQKDFQQGIKKMTLTFEVCYTKKVPNTMVPVQVGLLVEKTGDAENLTE